MKKRKLGKTLEVSEIGYGCMGINFGIGHGIEHKEGVALIRVEALFRGLMQEFFYNIKPVAYT